MSRFAESHVEEAALQWLSGLGYAVLHRPNISPDGAASERVSYGDVILLGRFRAALERFNPHLSKLMSGVLGQRSLSRTSWKKQGTMK